MSNVRQPGKPIDSDLIGKVLGSFDHRPELRAVPGLDDEPSEKAELSVFEQESIAEVHDLIGVAPLRQLGLNDDEMISLTLFALLTEQPVLEAAGHMIRQALDVSGMLGSSD